MRAALFVALTALASGCIDAAPTSPDTALTLDGLVRELGQQGLTVAVRETMPRDAYPFFSVPARGLVVNGEDVTVFAYASASNAASQAALVSSSGTPIGTSQITWIAPPRFYRKERLIVLYVGRDIVVARALAAVLGEPFVGTS